MRVTDRDLLPLGQVSPAAGLAEAARAGLADPERTVAFLRRHRVVGLGLRELALFSAGRPLPAPLAILRTRREALDTVLSQGEAQLAAAVSMTGVAVHGIKGLTMRTLYQTPADRDIGDLDLMVRDVDDAWELASYFRSQGFDWCEYEWPWVKRDTRSGQLYGQFQVWRATGADYLRFDIHFGGYSVRHCRRSDWAGPVSGYHPADPAANLPCLLGNAAGDFLIRLKDVNDIVVMLRRGLLDRDTVQTTVTRLGLERFWNTLLSRARALTALTSAEDAVLAVLSVREARAQRVPFGIPSRAARTFATAFDAARAGRDDHGLREGVATGLSAFRYYASDLSVQVSPCKHTRPPAVVSRMSNSACVRLIPQRMLNPGGDSTTASARRAISGSELLEEVIAAHHAFVEAGGERFVPTIFGRLCFVEAGGAPARSGG